MAWETVMGLEVHVELATKTKIFCSCTTEFGGEANTHCCPVCTGMPGTLPVLNKKVLEYAVKAGLALGCEITRYNKFDRKNYFYPDLPKAYQISQLYLPFAQNGCVDITTRSGKKASVRIHEIHMEEDAGKLVHSPWGDVTYPDYNRCGVPLIEIVSEPDFRSAEEVIAYLEKLKSTLMYLGVSDCKMEEGSMRADVNLSVREAGSEKFGTRTEMKNINSFKAIERAIKYESKRQIKVLEDGGRVIQETRRWDDNKGRSYAMRSKENAQDYRYFPEPDIPPISISDELIDKLKSEQPEFADAKAERYASDFGIDKELASVITVYKNIADLFEQTSEICKNPVETAAWISKEVMYLCKEDGVELSAVNIAPEDFADFVNLIKDGTVNRQSAVKVFEALFRADGRFDVKKYVDDNDLAQLNDEGVVAAAVKDVIAKNEKAAAQYKTGETKVLGFLVGQTMKALKGKGKPDLVNKLLKKELGE